MTLWCFDKFVFDSRSGSLSRADEPPIVLRHKLAQLLAYLLEHRERPVTKDELLDTLWHHGDYRERSLTQSIRELRQALGDSAQQPVFIRTFPQRGYQWIAPATTDTGAAAAKSQPKTRWAMLGGALALGLTLALGVWLLSTNPPKTQADSSPPSVLVLPFSNETGDPTLDWLQLGYADMLARTLAQSGAVRVTPPGTATALLASSGLDWPTLPTYLQGLLREQGIDQALVARVRLHNRSQVLDFQLMSAEGAVQQGSIAYPSLTDATGQTALQLLHLLAPEQDNTLPELALPGQSPEAALARQVLAEGISAMQTQGAARADELFQAADLLVKDDPWVTACRAKSQLLTGQWREATARLEQLRQREAQHPSLAAFVHYWSAQLAFRQGDMSTSRKHLDSAIAEAERQQNVEVLANSYRLQAQIAWQAMDWQAFTQWQAKADNIIPPNASLSVEADRLFYLGNPISQGLEKFPGEDLAKSAELIKRAHRFYSELGHLPMIAASELALARNEALPLAERTAVLEQAITRYAELRQPYELTQALIYATYFYLQRHQGELAEARILRARDTAATLSDHGLDQAIVFYHAFALLDQGLDQRHRGLHGPDTEKLRAAIAQFDQLLQSQEPSVMRANALVLQGWAYANLGDDEKALHNQRLAMAASEHLNLDTSYGYAVYSAMRVYLEQGDFDKVVALADKPVTTRQQLAYAARAFYELGQFDQALQTQQRLQQTFANQWTDADSERLEDYQLAVQSGRSRILSGELPAHAIYCESDWYLQPGA